MKKLFAKHWNIFENYTDQGNSIYEASWIYSKIVIVLSYRINHPRKALDHFINRNPLFWWEQFRKLSSKIKPKSRKLIPTQLKYNKNELLNGLLLYEWAEKKDTCSIKFSRFTILKRVGQIIEFHVMRFFFFYFFYF